MKKLFYTIGLLLVASIIFTSCSNNPPGIGNPTATTDPGVFIGYIDGEPIRWATRNVDTPGRFVANPENTGGLFQWGTLNGVTHHSGNIPAGGFYDYLTATSARVAWTPANDPCPRGWRVPTLAELRVLHNAGSEWVKYGSRQHPGLRFGSDNAYIFMPARIQSPTMHGNQMIPHYFASAYWANCDTYDWHRYVLSVREDRTGLFWDYSCSLNSVRCVAVSNESNRTRETNRADEANVPRLDERTVQFSENFFIALNLVNNYSHRSLAGPRYLRFQSIVDILRAVRAKGHTDIRRAYAISDSLDSFRYIEDLGLDRNNVYLWIAFVALYSEPVNWRMPELQSTLIETLDNGTEIWRVRDFVTMHQARLSVSADDLSIGNAERFSLGD